MSDLSECFYGMGFGPEGDGVELMSHYKVGDTLTLDILTGTIKHHSGADLKPVKAVDATMRWASPKRDVGRFEMEEIRKAFGVQTPKKPGSFESIQWPQWAFEDKPESNAKPALPALTRQAGEKYKGLGFNDGMDQ